MTLESLIGSDISSLIIDPKLIVIILIAMAWKFAWYGLAIWKTIEEKNKRMFVIFFVLMLIINDLGIIPIVYLWMTQKKTKPAANNNIRIVKKSTKKNK